MHDVARREAASRYQRSRRGRLQHAARSRRWRQRVADHADAEHKVTHQGSPTEVVAAPLAACTSDITTIATDPAVGAPASPPLQRCYRCAAVQPDWLRQDFLRRGRHAMTLATGRRHDHGP